MAPKNSQGIKQAVQSMASLLAPFTTQRAMPASLTYKKPADVLTLPTGFRSLDKALGVGGLPYGEITELMGPGTAPISDGTTNIAAYIASKVQRRQELVTIVDMNHSFDSWQAERCGLAAPHLFLVRPDTIFTALTTLERAAHNTTLVVVLLGAVTNLLHDIEPSLLKTLLRRLQNITRQSKSVFLFLTSPDAEDPFSPTNYPPGFPLADIATVRLWVQNETWTHKDGVSTAYKANLTVIKNELATAGKGAGIRIKLNSF